MQYERRAHPCTERMPHDERGLGLKLECKMNYRATVNMCTSVSITQLPHKNHHRVSHIQIIKQISVLKYVEIKCQLDATEVFIADLIACSTCFGHHYAHYQELKSIIQWLLRVVFSAVVFQVAGLVWS